MSQETTAAVLRRLALDESTKALVLTTPALYTPLVRAASRYIGGETLADCLTVAQSCNERGHAVSLDYMGESSRTREKATAATDELLRAAAAIRAGTLNASLSIDLSHIGLLIDEMFCFENAMAIAVACAQAKTEVMISAEGPDRTDAVLAMHGRLCQQMPNVGITLQAYLHRTRDDFDAIIERPGKIRIVKGAFDADPSLVMPRGEHLDSVFVSLIRKLDHEQQPFSVATHDPVIIERVTSAMDQGIGEYEMLRGIESERLDALHDDGYLTRVYLPYGTDWFLYLCNRIAECPPSLFDAIAAAFGD